MEIKGDNNTTQKTPSQEAPKSQDFNMNQGGGSAPNARNIMDIMSGFNTPSQLSEEARAYAKTLTSLVQNANLGIKVVPIVADQIEANIFTDKSGKLGIAMVFADTYQSMDDSPVAEKVMDIVARFNAINGGNLLETIIVVKEDYGRVEKMASHIINTFRVTSDNTIGSLTLESFRGTDLLVSTNINKVRSYIQSRSPHGIPARDDIGFVLFAQGRRPDVRQWGAQEQRELIPLMGVTGYTEFIATSGGYGVEGPKFLPVIRITDIVSDIPNKNLLPLAIMLSADMFIRQHNWLSAFQSFAKNEPNIGALIPTQEGTHWHADNIRARNEMINKYIQPPYLAIDVTEGRARIAGLDKFVYNPAAIMQDAAQFLGVQATSNTNPVIKTWAEYLGYIHDGVGLRDGRYVDYLKLATNIKDPGKISQFLYTENHPANRPKQIREIGYTDYKTIYRCMTSALHGQFITDMASQVASKAGLSLTYEQQDRPLEFSSALMDGSGNDFKGFGGIGGGGHAGFDFTKSGSPYGW